MRKRAKPPARPVIVPAHGLSPRGAIASRFGDAGAGDDLLRGLRRAAARFDLGEHGVHLAEEVLGCDPYLSGKDRDALAVALLATQVAARQGSTRVSLDRALPSLVTAVLTAAGSDAAPAAVTADIVRLAGQSGLGGLIGGPLIVDAGCLYQHRLWTLETSLARLLKQRIAAATPVEPLLDHPDGVTLTQQQVSAVRTALAGKLAVISGGPGTGKSTIIATVVRSLTHVGLEVALAAPTGKAAARIGAQTLHRLLGWRPDGTFRHSELSPLPHDAVIVDEASMVDLALMERLARAVRPDARLILVGDAHQLPSVDAGAVLAELVAVARVAGAPWAIELTESHRMRADDPDGRAILEAARAIDAGVAQRLGANRVGVEHATGRGVELVRVETAAQLGAALDAWWRVATAGDLQALSRRAFELHDPDLRRLLAYHERMRLLTVTRGLDTGAAAINARLHAHMLAGMSVEQAPDFVPGEPVLITVNDYERGLYNGDQGVIARVIDREGVQRWRAIFPKGDELIALPIDAIRSSLELAWAMTVHKSQGSELDRVAVILPREDQPLCTRELLYTAVTRARRGVLLLGTSEILEAAVARTSSRDTGLAARL